MRAQVYRRLQVLGLVPIAASCKVDDAPPTVSAVLSDVWRAFDDEDDVALQEVVRDALQVFDVDGLAQDRERGSQDRFSVEDLDGLTFVDAEGEPTEPPDPTVARPLYLTERLPCTLEQYTPILLHADQKEIYGRYDSYERRYKGEARAFGDRDLDRIAWSGTIGTSVPLAGSYVYSFEAQARWFDLPDDVDLVGTQGLVSRTWMPHPAAWEGDSSFDQDYQLEVFLQVSATEVLHVYPIWRVMNTPLGDMENDGVASITLDQMVGWGNTTAQLCREGRP